VIVVDTSGKIAWVDELPFAAAHSMDTTWYAVDANGHVGYMTSGEEGSVPYIAHRQYWSEVFEELVIAHVMGSEQTALQLARHRARDPVEVGLLDAIIAGDRHSREVYADWLEGHGRDLGAWNPRDHLVYRVGATITTIDPATLPAEWSGILRFVDHNELELWRDHFITEPRELDEQLGMTNVLAGSAIQKVVFDPYWESGSIVSAYLIDEDVEPQHVGLYHFGCSFAGDYARRAVPRDPLHIDELPAPLREKLAQLRIDRSFDAMEWLDPEAFTDCQRYRDD